MKTALKTLSFLAVAACFGLSTKPAQAQVSFGVATPGFSLGVGPGAGYVGGGYGYGYGYPIVAPAPIIAPRPVFVPPPVVYGRPYYGGYYGRPGYGYGRGGYGYGGPRYYRR